MLNKKLLQIDFTSRKVYGLIIMLSLIVTLENYTHSGSKILLGIFGTLFFIAMAEVYVKIIYFMSKYKKRIPKGEFNILLKEELSILYSLDLPIIFYLLYFFRFISVDNFLLLIKIGGVLLLFFYGYTLGILLKKSILRKFILGFFTALFGIFIITFKLYFKF